MKPKQSIPGGWIWLYYLDPASKPPAAACCRLVSAVCCCPALLSLLWQCAAAGCTGAQCQSSWVGGWPVALVPIGTHPLRHGGSVCVLHVPDP